LKGCDSISLYKISIYKNPSALSLGLDTCFNGNDTLTINATGGYDKYTWMSDYLTTSSSYTARDTGIYTVTVSNVCGTKTDSIHIYDQCDFPIYMPNAFTPNGDRLNDVFRVPPVNLNRLIQFTIYNRWGKIVFQTNNINKGWDGNVNYIPQQPGIYIYYLQMESLIGKAINQKGTFTLIR
jgi:gliding motility-associated-like protein